MPLTALWYGGICFTCSYDLYLYSDTREREALFSNQEHVANELLYAVLRLLKLQNTEFILLLNSNLRCSDLISCIVADNRQLLYSC